MLCYIGVVAKMYRLQASLLGLVAESLPWALSLLLKLRLSCPLVLGWGRDVDGWWNTRYWLVRCRVRAPRHIVCYIRRGWVVYYLQFIESVLQRLHLSLCCCCALCVEDNQFYIGEFVHCGFYGIELCPISFLA